MPRTVDPVERRSRVAAAARAVIARDGLDAASVRRVAAEAGSSTTVVTHYFPDKQALLMAAIQDAYAAVGARMAGHLEGGPGGLPTVRAILLEALPLDAEREAESRVWMAFWAAASTQPGCATCSARATGSGGSWWPGCWARPPPAARWPPTWTR